MTKWKALAFSAFVFVGAAAAADKAALKKIDDIANFSSCPNCDLTGAQIQGRLFRLANWPGADLSGAKLDNSDLSGAILWDAKLTGASMTYTNLSGAQLKGANLSSANLQFAWLLDAQAQNVNFGDADLTNARVRGMQVHGADLSRVKGLGKRELAEMCADNQTKPPPGEWIPRCSQ
jgi:uncharacterized protein YjbI with pentapeptide repeats